MQRIIEKKKEKTKIEYKWEHTSTVCVAELNSVESRLKTSSYHNPFHKLYSTLSLYACVLSRIE